MIKWIVFSYAVFVTLSVPLTHSGDMVFVVLLSVLWFMLGWLHRHTCA